MIYQDVELHNFVPAKGQPDADGITLQRLPEEVRVCLNDGAKAQSMMATCCEIRFVTDDGKAKIALSCPAGSMEVIPFFGSFHNNQRFWISQAPQTIEVNMPDYFRQLAPELERRSPAFSPRVCRLVCGSGPVRFHKAQGVGLRPPRPAELPRLRLLTYGTSITHQWCASAPYLCYAAQTARRLGADLINLGQSGAAQLEKELADYIASRKDWHVATLCISVNMLGAGFTIEQFQQRANYFVNTLAAADTRRPVACISILPFFGDFGKEYCNNYKASPEDYRRALREVVKASPPPNVYLFEGPQLMPDWDGLTTDLIHPADFGMSQIAENLARRLAPLVKPVAM